jgi:murein biosynthesis integral membrane protein MurJ
MSVGPAERATPPTAAWPGEASAGWDLAAPEGAVSDSLSVAAWTILSRLTGMLRAITVAAVLGVTYFANAYQFTNSLPNLIFYGLLAGSLFSSLLVPTLVPYVDSGDRALAARTAGSMLGAAMTGMLAIVPVVAVATPWLLHLGAAGAGGPAVANAEARTGAVLIILLLPQVPLYAVIGTAAAVMNAHRKFALAAAAPAIENLATIALLGVVAIRYSQPARQQHSPLSLLILLGAGTTGAVLLHATVQWCGARRLGVTLQPRAGWRDPQVRAVIRRAVPAASQAALVTAQLGLLLVVANAIAGGVVALQLAMNFYFLPIALGAGPVALSLMPRLSRMTGQDQGSLFRDTYLRGLTLAWFVAVPAAAAYAVLAAPLAKAVALGGFRTGGGAHLVAAALVGLAPGVIGETLFLVSTYACYARGDLRHPLRGMAIQSAVCALIVVAAHSLQGAALLTALGLAFSAGSLSASWYLVRHTRRSLPRGGERPLRSMAMSCACAAVMVTPALATATLLARRLDTPTGRILAVLTASVVGATIYFAAQAVVRAPEVAWGAQALRTWLPDRWRFPRLSWPAGLPGPAGAAGHAGSASLLATRPRPIRPAGRRLMLDAALLSGCAAIGGLAAVSLKYAVFALVLVGLGSWVMIKPPVAGYLLIFLTPLTVGVNAGKVVPYLRPNEGLMVALGAIVAVRWLVLARSGDRSVPRMDRVDASLIALGMTSSVVPLAMMAARHRAMTGDDYLYSLTIWKLVVEYVIVRCTITTREQIMRCLMLSMISAAIVCAVAVLQSASLFGVPGLLAKYYAPLGVTSAVSIGRGSSLLALPAAVGDLAVLNLGIAIAMIARGSPHRGWLRGLAVTCVLGVIAAAEFAPAIGLIVTLVTIVWLTRWRRLIGYAVVVAIAGALLLWPVIEIRLTGFQSSARMPASWLSRLQNLRTYFWPTLMSDYNWVLGVRPAARVPAPDQQYGYVWIESGYIWLLWAGGIPMIASYGALAVATIRKGLGVARRADVAGIVGTALVAAMVSQVVLMAIDPHLTYRGAGDAFFMLLALLRTPLRASTRAEVPRTAHRHSQNPGQPMEVLT